MSDEDDVHDTALILTNSVASDYDDDGKEFDLNAWAKVAEENVEGD